ncbi:MAG TPA: phosphodiester glycosidase family protein [Patescibacteria group bacterium]|nr:phosphodiester glycosidase family protein [Patescibacteria group bacterium]
MSAVRLADWCRDNAVPNAMSGAFFWRPAERCLGEIWVNGVRHQTEPFSTPWDRIRGTLHIIDGLVSIGGRNEFPEQPNGDLLQAGPLLVRRGRSMVADGQDAEGFSLAADQFDSDITDGRYPRSAVGCNDDCIFSVAVDGRGPGDAGLTMEELADCMVALGATDALNLDGGGTATLINGGVMRNTSRNDVLTTNPNGRPVHSAIVFSNL